MEITQQMREAGAQKLLYTSGQMPTGRAEEIFAAMLAVAPKPDAATVTEEMLRAGCKARRDSWEESDRNQVTAIYHAMRRIAPSLAAAQSTAMLRAELADAPNWARETTYSGTLAQHSAQLRAHDETVQDDGGDTERRAEMQHQQPDPAAVWSLKVLQALCVADALTIEQYQRAVAEVCRVG